MLHMSPALPQKLTKSLTEIDDTAQEQRTAAVVIKWFKGSCEVKPHSRKWLMQALPKLLHHKCCDCQIKEC